MRSTKGKTYEQIYGFEKAQELKKLRKEVFGQYNKGRTPWNKGGKDVRIKRGYKRPNHSKLMRERYLKGLWTPPCKNPIIAKRVSETRKRLFKEGKLTKSWNKGLTKEIDKRVKSLAEKSKGKKHLWTTKNNLENNPMNNPETLKKALKSRFKRPTGLEMQFINFFKRYNLQFTYCGNGLKIIGGKCPDFIESNGRKICIEVANKREKEAFKKYSWKEYEKQRIEHFAKYGWKCIVLWEDNLQNYCQSYAMCEI